MTPVSSNGSIFLSVSKAVFSFFLPESDPGPYINITLDAK